MKNKITIQSTPAWSVLIIILVIMGIAYHYAHVPLPVENQLKFRFSLNNSSYKEYTLNPGVSQVFRTNGQNWSVSPVEGVALIYINNNPRPIVDDGLTNNRLKISHDEISKITIKAKK